MIQVLRRPRPVGPTFTISAVVIVVAALAAAALIPTGRVPLPYLAGAVAALGYILIVAWRPWVGIAILSFAVPLTAGLGRNTVIPLLRTSEALLVLAAIGVAVHELPRRRPRPFIDLDLPVLLYTLSGTMIPAAVLLLSGLRPDLDGWRNVAAPLQLLLLYLVVSRTEIESRGLRLILNLALLDTMIVAVVGIAQLLDLPGVRSFLGTYYNPGGVALCQYGICRPTSLVEHWSSFGVYSAMGYAIALGLAVHRVRGFNPWWLAAVTVIDCAGLLASQTQAAYVGAVIITVLLVVHGRRFPPQLAGLGAAILLGLALFGTQVSDRIAQQLNGTVATVSTPESLQTRELYWSELFVPVLMDHPVFGTGTLISSEVPSRLEKFVDSEYLRQGFRSGVIGIGILLLLLAALFWTGWRSRRLADPLDRALGGMVATYGVSLAVMGWTADFLTFAVIAQQFWFMVALFAGRLILLRRPSLSGLVRLGVAEPNAGRYRWRPAGAGSEVPAHPRRARGPALPELLRSGLGRVAPAARRLPVAGPLLASLYRSNDVRHILSVASLQFIANSTARFLGLVFQALSGRLLGPSGYGVFAYALAVSNVGSILVINSPTGMARMLVTTRHDRAEQVRLYSNWVVVMAALVGLSLVIVPGGLLLLDSLPGAAHGFAHGLTGWMLVGLAGYLVGITIFQGYREVKRGQERFLSVAGFFITSNVIQVAAVVLAASLGLLSPAVFFAIPGASYLAALGLYTLIDPIRIPVDLSRVSWEGVRAVFGYTGPLLIQTAFYMIWFYADQLVLAHFVSNFELGNYAAAKTITNIVLLVPNALLTAMVPQVARRTGRDAFRYMLKVLATTAAACLPILLVSVVAPSLLVRIAYGGKYPLAGHFVPWLALAMVLYSFYSVLANAWLGLGNARIDAASTFTGMALTLVAAVLLVPAMGGIGGALAFGLGSLAQFVFILGFTLRCWPRTLPGEGPRRRRRRRLEALLGR